MNLVFKFKTQNRCALSRLTSNQSEIMKFKITIDPTLEDPTKKYTVEINETTHKFTSSLQDGKIVLETTKEDLDTHEYFEVFSAPWIIFGLISCGIGWKFNTNTWVEWFFAIEFFIVLFSGFSKRDALKKLGWWSLVFAVGFLFALFHEEISRLLGSIWSFITNLF